jgi:hypothetical protein
MRACVHARIWFNMHMHIYTVQLHCTPKVNCQKCPPWFSVHSLASFKQKFTVRSIILEGVCGSVVGWGTMLQIGRSQVRFPVRSLVCSFDLNLPASIWPRGRLSVLQKWVAGIFLGVKGGQHVRLTTWTLWADCLENVGAVTSHNPMGLHGLLQR